MGRLFYKNESKEVKDGTGIQEAAQSLGVPFGCTLGVCGTCESHITEGMENLSPLSPQEKAMDIQEGHRLLCQCTLLTGQVKVKHLLDE